MTFVLNRTLALVGALMLIGVAAAPAAALAAPSAADMQMRQQALARGDRLIVPGQRIGPVRIGEGMDEVMATLGAPDWSYINPGDRMKIGTEMDYHSWDMEIYFSNGAVPVVTSIAVIANTRRSMQIGKIMWSDIGPYNNVFQTAQGIGLGSTSFQAARAYGAYEDLEGIMMTFRQLGLGFSVTRDFKIWKVSVFR